MWWNMFMAFGTILSRNWIRDLTTMTKSFKIILTTSGENKLEIATTEIPDYQCHTFITLRTVTRFEHTLFVRPLIFIRILFRVWFEWNWILYISNYVDKHIPVWKNFFEHHYESSQVVSLVRVQHTNYIYCHIVAIAS